MTRQGGAWLRNLQRRHLPLRQTSSLPYLVSFVFCVFYKSLYLNWALDISSGYTCGILNLIFCCKNKSIKFSSWKEMRARSSAYFVK